ncbi:MAG: acyl-CoA dehydrogenase family protein [Chloroflexota bacterium]|nr:acyl-CoA dehydrogenase family protein [Chloroflexota bacterium]
MNFNFSEEETAFRQEVRDFIKKEVPPDFRGADVCTQWQEEAIDDLHSFANVMRRKLGAKGWLGMTWPKEYGGQDASFTKEYILADELTYNKVPGRDIYGITMIGPTILKLGTEAQKKKFLGEITRGEVVWCEGMSEPEAGSDLASLRTRAVLDGDEFVVNGEKIWSSGAHVADWYILFVRTDPDAPNNKGISCLLVDLKNTPGITFQTIQHMDGLFAFNSVFLDDVRVPKENLLGELNGGFKVLLELLNFERPFGGLAAIYARRIMDDLLEYAKETKRNGVLLVKDPIIRSRFAELATELEVGRMIINKVMWNQSRGQTIPIESTMVKLFGINVSRHVYNFGMQLLGLHGQLDEGSKWAPLHGQMVYLYLSSLGLLSAGGTTEVLKNTVAGVGLNMPRG